MRHVTVVSLLCCMALQADAEPLLLISIDGLHPDYVLQAQERGLNVPNLASFVTDGAYAKGVVGVIPTVTYPSHTTLVTGVAPAEHGIVSNTPFDPLGTNREGWFWYAEDLAAETLWAAADRAGLSTASVNWPVTVGDRHIDVLLPEFWRAANADDLKLLAALSRPEGVLERLGAELGPFVDGYTDTVESDEIRTRFALAVLRDSRPDFMGVHLIALDGTQHREGPWTRPAYDALEAIDAMVGRLVTASLANHADAVIAIVSDHGFLATHTAVHLGARFVEAGLIRLEQPSADAAPHVAAWDAQVWTAGGVAAIVLREPTDTELHARVAALLEELRAEPRNGIARLLGRAELERAASFPTAEFVVEAAPGFYFGPALRGPLLTPATSKGTHGYLPDRTELHASLFVKGKRIAAGRDLEIVDMRSIAPTLASVLGVNLADASEPPLPIR